MNEPFAGHDPLLPHQTRIEPVRIPDYRHLQDAQSLTRLTGNGNYTWIELMGQQKPILVSQTLKYFEQQLPDFVRVSKSILLNPGWVVGLQQPNAKTLHLELADGSRIDVPRRRIQATIYKLGKGACPITSPH